MTEIEKHRDLLLRIIPLLSDSSLIIEDLLKELLHTIDMDCQRHIMLSRECDLLRETVAIQNQKDNPLHRRIGELTKEVRELKSKKK